MSILSCRVGTLAAVQAQGGSPSRSVKTSTAYEYHRLINEALMSRGVPQAPAVNQAFMLEQESIDDVIASAKVYSHQSATMETPRLVSVQVVMNLQPRR